MKRFWQSPHAYFGKPLAQVKKIKIRVDQRQGGFMKNQIKQLCLWVVAICFLCAGIALSAQQTAPQGQAPDQAQPAPPPTSQPPAAQGQGTTPSAQAAQPNGTQAFSGTIVKSGDRYMLQDESSGQTYDLDHQDEVQKFAGKRVRVHGTLDPNGKMIHLQ
jgi:uncharacterized protein YdeI (BOF family)